MSAPHGTQACYKNGCRRPACTDAARRARTVYLLRVMADGPRRVNAVGSRRRILALGMIGWPLRHVATKSGITVRQLQRIGSGAARTVNADTADAIRRAYDALSMTPAPPGRNRSERVGRALAVNAARRHGGHVPLAWDDDTIDDPAAKPDRAALRRPARRTPADLAEDVEDILSHNPLTTATQIADRLGYADNSGVQNGLERAGRADLLARLARNADLMAGAA